MGKASRNKRDRRDYRGPKCVHCGQPKLIGKTFCLPCEIRYLERCKQPEAPWEEIYGGPVDWISMIEAWATDYPDS